MLTKPKEESFIGKTVESIDASCVNCLILNFTDGSKVVLETDPAVQGIWGIFQSEEE